MPEISIIVPVYKAEKYLCKCVDSLLAQTFGDFEVLLIDDGSPDRSGQICDQYAARDSRVHVFHQENGGVSSARQTGLDHARGEYVIHADPDDWVEPDMLEELHRKAKTENADMVICDFYIDGPHGCKQVCQRPPQDDLLQSFLFQRLHGSCCNKLVKKACFLLNNISFPQELSMWEDLYINCKIAATDIKWCYLEKAFYHYDIIQNPHSAIHKSTMSILRSKQAYVHRLEKEFGETAFAAAITANKIKVKEWAFAAGLLSDEAMDALYPEITQVYLTINEKPTTAHGLFTRIMKLHMTGHYRMARITRKLYNWSARLKHAFFH